MSYNWVFFFSKWSTIRYDKQGKPHKTVAFVYEWTQTFWEFIHDILENKILPNQTFEIFVFVLVSPGSSDFFGLNHYYTETVKHGFVEIDPSFERDVEAVSIESNVSMKTAVWGKRKTNIK